jgi:hypothetical protein
MNANRTPDRGFLAEPESPTTRHLREYAVSLGPDLATLGRVRARARSAYITQFQPAVDRAMGAASSTFFGRRAATVLLGIILFAATFGDIRLCAGLSVFGFGTFLMRATPAFGDAFVVVGLLATIVGLLELLFAFGVWARRDWALPLGIGVEVAGIILSLAWILVGAAMPLHALSGLVSFAVLAALAQAPVRAAMRRPQPGFPWRLQS